MNGAREMLSSWLPPLSAFDAETLSYLCLIALSLVLIAIGARKWRERIETEQLRAERDKRSKIS